MSFKTDPYSPYYLDGREDISEGRIRNAEVDLGEIVAKIKKPEDIRACCLAAASNALSSQSSGPGKRKYLAEMAKDIADGKLSENLAWSRYLAGQIDELAAILEGEVVEELRAELEEGEDASGDEADDDDGDEEDGEDDADDEADDEGDDDEDDEDDLDDAPDDVQ